MAMHSNQEVAGASAAQLDGDTALLVAESTRVPDLPGLFKKKVVIGSEETGLLASNGSVVAELGAGSNKVGWSFMGFGGGKKDALRLRSRSFSLQLHFSNLLSKGYENLDAVIHVTASVTTPSLFYSTMLRGRDRLSSAELASTIAALVDDLVQIKVTQTDGQALRHDEAAQSQLTAELEPHLSRALEERGLRLESVDLAAFHNPGEVDELLSELAEFDTLMDRRQKPGREDVQRALTRLRSTGLATPEMAERAQLVFDGGTDDAFFRVMKDISVASRRRLEARVVDRSEQLSKKLNAEDTSGVRGGPSGVEKGLKFVGPLAGVAGLVYRIIPDLAAAWGVLIAGLVTGFVLIAGYLWVRVRRIAGQRKPDEIVIRLDKWAKKNSMETDELVRRQMGREFSNSLADVKDAKLAAFRQEKREIADALGELENRMDLMRTEVESAPAASTIVSAKGFPTQRISRMVSFEEDLLRQARNLSIRTQTAKESLNSEDVDALRTGLDHFQRTFSKRLGFLEGFKEL